MTTNQSIFDARYHADLYQPKDDYFRGLQNVRLAMLRQLPPGARLLDVGCGSGTYLLPLLESGYHVTGVDCSPTILTELRTEAAARGLRPDAIDVHVGDATQLPIEAAKFDCVFSFATLYAVQDIERALAEVERVLRPGGVAMLELGNVRSLNHVEATRVGTGLESFHQTPARMRHLLRNSGLAVQSVRAFQLFPLWGGGTERAERVLNPRLVDAMSIDLDGQMLDERLSNLPWLQPFAFRQLWCVQKGGPHHPAERVPPLPPESDAQREQRRLAASDAATGRVQQAVTRLVACLGNHPHDPRPAFDLAALYDGDREQQLVRRWRRTLTATGVLPATGAALSNANGDTPRISIVLPTHNAGHMLAEAVQSVFAQTLGAFELIIVDDGSTDDTPRFLSRLHDPRVQIVRQRNRGLPNALNAGFEHARGDLLTWISADNLCEPTMLQRLVETMDANPQAQLAVAGFARIDPRGRVLDVVTGQDISHAGFLPRNPGVAAFAYRRATAAKVGNYDDALLGAEDWDYWLRLLQHGPAVRIDDVLCRYREHARSMTATIPLTVQQASERVVQRWLQTHGGLPTHLLEHTVDAWFVFGTKLLLSPFVDDKFAAQALQRAVQLQPSDVRAIVQWSVALARAGEHAQAAEVARAYASHAAPELLQLAAAIQRLAAGDRTVQPMQLPLIPADEPMPTCAG